MNKKKFYIMFLFLIGVILITVGTAYSWFSYIKEGTKTVAITTRSVKLHYQEHDLKQINLTNALPMDNDRGKQQDNYFEFTITSQTAMFEIPYYVTSRIITEDEKLIPKEYITLYLTEVIDNVEVERLLTTYDSLDIVEKNNHLEEKIYNTIVQAETPNYEKVFRLRVWVNDSADYSPQEINNETVYPMQDKEFEFIINVYTEVDEAGVPYIDPEPDGEYIREICEETIIYDSDKTYKIKTAEDLACFSKLIKEETYFNNANTVVVSNVDINQDNSYFYMTGEKSTMYGDINEDGEISNLKTELTTGKGFYPIGRTYNDTKMFKGTLNGNGFTISNLMVNRPSEENVGLFGAATATIENIIIDNINIAGKKNVGGLVGQNGGNIRNIHISSTITGSSTNYAGGVIGKNEDSGSLTLAWITSNVTGGYSGTGGIAGISTGILNDIIASVEVSGDDDVGGIAGYSKPDKASNILLRRAVINGRTNYVGAGSGGGTPNGMLVESGSSNKATFGFLGCTNCHYLTTFTSTRIQDYQYALGTKNISGYENALDTYMGGDNDNSGWYFRPDDNGEFQLVNIEEYPIIFNLEGSGTENNPYLIKTTDDWNNAVIKANQPGIYFKIVNNLDFTGKTFVKMGSPRNIFDGTLDGNNKTISGIFLDGGSFTGLIGYTGSNAVIKDLTLEDITIENGGTYTGALVGYNTTSNITNVVLRNSSIGGNASVGGYLGYNSGNLSNLDVDNVTVAGNSNVGGLIGENSGELTYLHLKADVLTTRSTDAGGVIGRNESTGSLKLAWVTTKVTGGNIKTGGLVGYNLGILNDIDASVEASGYDDVGGVAGYSVTGNATNILFRKAVVSGNNNYVGAGSGGGIPNGILVESGSSNKATFGFNGCTNCHYLSTFTHETIEQNYRYTLGTKNVSGYENALDTYMGGDNDNSGWYFRQDDNGEFQLVKVSDYPIIFNLEGSGTENNPYLIKTTDDWNNAVIKANQPGIHFKIVNDLDFTGKTFVKMGSPRNIFDGTLDGNNKTISGIFLDGGSFTGLIGYTGSNAIIKDLTLENITIENGGHYTGALVGYNTTSNITNVVLRNSSIGGNVSVGGYLGYNSGNLSNLDVDNVTVAGNSNVGGLIGENSGAITYLHLKADVLTTHSTNAGGVIGRNESTGSLKLAWVTTKVTGGSSKTGGLVGYNLGILNDIDASVEASGYDDVGGVAGYSVTDNATNILLRKAVITGNNNYVGAGSGGGIPNGILVETGSSNKATFGFLGCTNCHYLSTFTYGTREQDYRYTLGTKNVSGYENALDTYMGGDNDNSGWYFRQDTDGEFYLVKVSDYPIVFNLEGSGTESNPYLIKTTDDWNNAVIKANQSGIHFKIVNNLDFTGKTFVKMGSPRNIFNGTLDGNNKTISGIFLDGGSFTGLIGYTGSNAVIKDLTLENITIENGGHYTGALVGYNTTSNITNVVLRNSSIGGNASVGGYLGYNSGNLSNLTIENVTVTGNSKVGGLIGENAGTIKNLHISSTIAGQSTTYAGGVIGYNNTGSSLEVAWVNSKITGGYDNVGGIAGTNLGKLNEIVVSTEVSGRDNVGGVTGAVSNDLTSNILVKKAIVTGTTNFVGAASGNGTPREIMVESGSSSKYPFGFHGCTLCYYIEGYACNSNQSTMIASSYYNDLTKYNDILETSIDGDLNNSGWYFGYNQSGKIDLISAN